MRAGHQFAKASNHAIPLIGEHGAARQKRISRVIHGRQQPGWLDERDDFSFIVTANCGLARGH